MSARTLHERTATFLEILRLFGETVRKLPTARRRMPEVMQATAQTAVSSLPIIVVSTAFAGLVTTDEIAWHMNRALSTVSMIPGFTAQFILRELGVAVPLFLLVAKVGAATTAEVGSMKITEQIDALKLLRIDPVEYLVVPRFIAAIVAGATLSLIAASVTLVCAMSVAVGRYNFMGLEYLNAVRNFLNPSDVACTLIKGMIFGSIIPVISCGYGFRCRGGAEGVGSATTNAVVAATVSIIALDLVLTWLFSAILY